VVRTRKLLGDSRQRSVNVVCFENTQEEETCSLWTVHFLTKSGDGSAFKRSLCLVRSRLFHRHVHAFLGVLLKNQGLTRRELESLNWQKRKLLLTYAFDRVPIYRKKYAEAGLRPSDIRSVEDFEKLPIIRRDDLRDHFGDFVSEDARTLPQRVISFKTTGGSTGTPVRIMHDKRVPIEALRHRSYSWWGLDPFVNTAYVRMAYPASRLAEQASSSRPRSLLYRLAMWPRRDILLDGSSMTEVAIRRFVCEFNRLKPAILKGAVGAIHRLAIFAEENDATFHSPKAIMATSSPFSQSERIRIQRVFSAPVYDMYGSAEVDWIAAQCQEMSGLHIFYDSRHVESVDEDNHAVSHGELGRILLTDLENFLFPLIRYENGDQGRLLPDSCSCGISLPLMDKILGRVSDIILLPDKTSIAGEYLTTIFDRFPDAVRGFQVVQKKDCSIHVIYVPAAPNNVLAKALGSVEEELRKRTRGQVPIIFKAVSEVPHDRGKLRYVIRQ
jgi:phenylacetate-CoA ligase